MSMSCCPREHMTNHELLSVTVFFLDKKNSEI